MRLTLRTLLAYLDDILDPADAQQLGSKINESEFATALVHQIRGSVRRLRLDAPALDAQGVGSELNSVAEYLDNVLPPDQVPALEKACLDDEINLGEVAACHQILTLVLGEAAPVTDSMRKSAYGIAPTVALPSTSGTQTVAHDAHAAVPPPTSTMIVGPAAYPSELAPPSSPETASPEPSEDVSKPSAPSKKKITRIDGPSTKETWRAESEAIEADQLSKGASDDDDAVAVVPLTAGAAAATVEPEAESTAVATATVVRHDRIADAYPDYMPRKSSWIRSAFLTGIIALLILAGLLFATGTIRDNFVTRWLGQERQVAKVPTTEGTNTVAPSPEATLPPVPEPPTSIREEVSIVSPNLQEPELPNQELPDVAEEPDAILDVSRDGVDELSEPMTLDPPPAPSRFEPTGDALPELVANDNFRVPLQGIDDTASLDPLPEPAPVEPNVAISRTSDADPVPTTDAITSNPEVQEAATATAPVDNWIVDRAEDVDAAPNVVLDPVDEAPIADEPTVLDTESTTEAANSHALATDSTSSSNVAFDTVTTDTSTALESADIEPPVASSPDIGDLAVSTRQPLEPSVPSEVEPDTMEPDVGNRAKPTSLRRNDQLLLLFDSESQTWQRASADLQLQEGDPLLGMPAFRSDIQIGDSLRCSIHGVARLRLGPGNDITILDGNLVFSNQGAAESQGIRFHGRRFEINMIDPGTSVAIEASHEYVPGSDIGNSAPHALLKIIPLDNSISVSFQDQNFEIPKGRHLLALDEYPPWQGKSSRMPKWMKEESVKRIDALARDHWKKQLQDVTDIRDWLQTQSESKRPHQFSLAARCLAEMDDFSAVVAALSDQSQSGGQYWMDHFQTLRQALTRGPDVQNLIRIELEQAYGKGQADLMMEMLRGYSDRQLAAGSAAMLVENLASSQLEMRVLAIENLFQITGARDYRAGDSLSSRSNDVRGWQKRFRTGRLRYRTIPEIARLLEFAEEQQE